MWSPSERAFRRLLSLAIVLYAISLADAHYNFLPVAEGVDELRRRWSGVGTWFNSGQWLRAWLLLNVGTFLSLLGMYLYWDIARWGALLFTIVCAISGLFFGVAVSTPAQQLLSGAAWTAIDAVVAMSFLSPLAHHFTGEQIVPPTLVDDEA